MPPRIYPIVFAAGPAPVPAAVVGLTQDSNLFLMKMANGSAAAICHLCSPLSLLLMDDPEQKQYVLCVDEAAICSHGSEYELFRMVSPRRSPKAR